MERKYYELRDVLAGVRGSLEKTFPGSLWIVAEIARLNVRQNGHCYVELSQQESGVHVAEARGVIWRSRWVLLEPYFRTVTGSTLDAGMKILVKARVRFHEIYGFSLDIEDIDPQFTIGEKEVRRQQTIERLVKEGLMNMQKQLQLARLPYRFAVISASTAAGYGDFSDHLGNNAGGYVFEWELFEALMQGSGAPSSIISTIAEIESSQVHYDAVLILRGGGSELDLACYDDYELAVAIAKCHLPVFTAIGHEQDFHVADMVAFDYVKTPTALADYFVSLYAAEDEKLNSCEQRLAIAFANRISSMDARLDSLSLRIGHVASARVQAAFHGIDIMENRISGRLRLRLEGEEHGLDRFSDRVLRKVSMKISRSENALDKVEMEIARRVDRILSDAVSHLMNIETRISSTDPRRILQRGFVLALDSSGVKMSTAAFSRPGDMVQMMFADGTLKCGVLEVDKRSNLPDAGEGPEKMKQTV